MFNIQVKGIEIRCKDSGSGPPVLLLHGFGGQPSDWRAVENSLKKTYSVFTPSLSRVLLTAKTFTEQVEFVEALVREFEYRFGKPVLVGASYGGALCWAVAQRTPEILSRMILVNPMPPKPIARMASQPLRNLVMMSRFPFFLSIYLRSPFGKRTVTMLANSVRAEWAGRFRRFNLMLCKKQKWVSALLKRFAQLLTKENWDKWEQGFTQEGPESLIILGAKDQLFGCEHGEWLAQSIGNCELVIIENGAHMAIRTHPEEVLNELSQFLDEPESAVS